MDGDQDPQRQVRSRGTRGAAWGAVGLYAAALVTPALKLGGDVVWGFAAVPLSLVGLLMFKQPDTMNLLYALASAAGVVANVTFLVAVATSRGNRGRRAARRNFWWGMTATACAVTSLALLAASGKLAAVYPGAVAWVASMVLVTVRARRIAQSGEADPTARGFEVVGVAGPAPAEAGPVAPATEAGRGPAESRRATRPQRATRPWLALSVLAVVAMAVAAAGWWWSAADPPPRYRARTFPGIGLSQAVAFSPDGTKLAGADPVGNGAVAVDVESGQVAARYLPDPAMTRQDRVYYDQLAFSPDGRHLAGTNVRGGRATWDALGGGPPVPGSAVSDGPPKSYSSEDVPPLVMSLDSPDGRYRATWHRHEPTVTIRTAADDRLVCVLRAEHIHSVAFRPDGREVAVAVCNMSGMIAKSGVRVWETAGGRRVLDDTLVGPGVVTGLVWSPDGRRFAVATDRGVIVYEEAADAP